MRRFGRADTIRGCVAFVRFVGTFARTATEQGRGRGDSEEQTRSVAASPRFVVREVKVAWLRNLSSPNVRLVYVRQDFSPTLAVPDAKASYHGNPIDQGPHQLEDVEEEFIDVAIERHTAVWGRDPEVVVNDDLAWLSWAKRKAKP